MQKRKRILGAALGTMLGLSLLFSPYAKLNTVYGANAPVTINETNFPDAVFRQYVKDNFDTDGNDELSVSEMENVTEIQVEASSVTDLTGVENFANLEKLYCSNNQLSSLDVSHNIALTRLSCSRNQISSLDVSQNVALNILSCSNNQLSSLDVSRNLSLQNLSCYNNQLSSLNIGQNSVLEFLDCYGNQLSSLDVSQNVALETLQCFGNQLSSLDVSHNPALTSLSCNSNQLSSLDVSQNVALKSLQCQHNQLSSLDVSHNVALESLNCSFNQLSSLDLSRNTNLNLGSVLTGENQISLSLYQSGSEYYIDLSSLPLETGRVSNSSVGSYNAENGHIEGLTLDINGGNLVYQYNIGWQNRLMSVTVNISGDPVTEEPGTEGTTEKPSTEGTTEKQDTAQTTEAVPTEQITTQSTQAENTSQNTPKTGDTMLPVWMAILGLFSTVCYFAARKGNGIK